MRPRTQILFLVALGSALSVTTARADYTGTISAPTNGFTSVPTGELTEVGSVSWGLTDYTVYNVLLTMYDQGGQRTQTWADVDVGYFSTSFTGILSFSNATVGTAGITTRLYNYSVEYLTSLRVISGGIIRPPG